MEFINYRLPGGRVVPCDASATKGAREIDFTLEDGRIVKAYRVEGPEDIARRQLEARIWALKVDRQSLRCGRQTPDRLKSIAVLDAELERLDAERKGLAHAD